MKWGMCWQQWVLSGGPVPCRREGRQLLVYGTPEGGVRAREWMLLEGRAQPHTTVGAAQTWVASRDRSALREHSPRPPPATVPASALWGVPGLSQPGKGRRGVYKATTSVISSLSLKV